MLREKEGVRYHHSVCQSHLSAHALRRKLHVARAIHMARHRRLNLFQEKVAVVTYHLRGELVNSSLTRAEYDVKIDCMLRRCVTVQEKLLMEVERRGEELCGRIRNLKNTAEDEGDDVFIGKRVHSATAAPFYHDSSTMALSDLGSTVGSIPVDPSGQAILYDLCEDLSRTHDDEEKCAPQWHCSDILCKLPDNWCLQ